MATRTYIADKETLDAVKANTDGILAAVGTENEKTGWKRYGVKINTLDSNPETRCEYIFDAVGMEPAGMDFTNGAFDYGDWGDNWMVTGNYPVMLKYDGTVDYKLDPNDYSKKLDGTASDYNITTYEGNVMARIPKAYLANYTVGNYEYIVFCEHRYDESYHTYPFTREDGTEMDCFYSSVYHGYNDGTRMRSISGVQPTTSLSGTTELALAQANGDLWYTKTWAQRNHINCLLILLGKSTNTQAVYGQGNSTGYDAESETKGILQTGMLDQSGQFWGSSATTSQVKIFHIESYWGDVWDRIAGLMMKDGTIRAKMTPPYNTTADGYADTGISPTGTSGSYIKACASDPVFGILPNSTGGSSSTYFPDYFYYSETATTYALVGGSCSYGSGCGGSALFLSFSVSYPYWYIGSSLSCEQPAA